jgi:DNA-binding response OmpR family regulator
MMKILIVEDDTSLLASLTEYLQGEGFAITTATSAKEAEREFALRPDLVVLDWMLPDRQGIDLLRQLRQQGSAVPVIFLTARADLVDKVLGLETGANDYITKPFEPRELVARIRVHLRSNLPASAAESRLQAGEIEMDDLEKRVFYRKRDVILTKMEYSLLRLFLENPNRVFSRDELLNKVWGYESYPTTRTVDNHILQLRQKLSESLFETVRGIGYRLKLTKS